MTAASRVQPRRGELGRRSAALITQGASLQRRAGQPLAEPLGRTGRPSATRAAATPPPAQHLAPLPVRASASASGSGRTSPKTTTAGSSTTSGSTSAWPPRCKSRRRTEASRCPAAPPSLITWTGATSTRRNVRGLLQRRGDADASREAGLHCPVVPLDGAHRDDDAGKIEIESKVTAGTEATDQSDATFSITAPAPLPLKVDFNADGQSDILWHHQGDGSLYTWWLQRDRHRRSARTSRRRRSPTRGGRSAGSPTSTRTASRTSCGTTRPRATSTSGT